MASNAKGKKNWLLDKLKQLMTKVDLSLKKEFSFIEIANIVKLTGYSKKL